MNNDNQFAMQVGLGLTVMMVVAIVLAVAGVIVALIAVTGFVLDQWRRIYRYEGKTPVLWLAGITAVVALACVPAAIEQFRLFAYYMERQSDQAAGYAITAIALIVAIAIPTAGFWLYRKVQPISHVRIALIEMWHDQYRKADITKHERDTKIAQTIATGDNELERMVAESRRQPQQPVRQHVGSAFDVPEQD